MGEVSVGDGSILMSSSPSMAEVSAGDVRIVGLLVEDDEDVLDFGWKGRTRVSIESMEESSLYTRESRVAWQGC